MKIVFACCLCVFAVCCVYERAQSAEPAGEGTQRPTKLDREVRVTLGGSKVGVFVENGVSGFGEICFSALSGIR